MDAPILTGNKNIAEIDEIPSEQIIKRILLPAAERAIYLELEHHLLALDMTLKKSKKGEHEGYADIARRYLLSRNNCIW